MRIYIKAVLIVFGLLLLSRIPQFINSSASLEIVVSSVVELGFLIWGIIILKKERY